MSGWIKLERSLKTDIRFGKAAKKLDLKKILEAAVTDPERYASLRQTLLLGALAQLWLHADEHVGHNDLLRGSVDDINELIGVQDFCQVLPADWLQVVDSDHVKLTDFVEHNGTSARSRKLNSERQQRFRDKHRAEHPTIESNADVTPSNASNGSKQTKQTRRKETEGRGDARGDAAVIRPPPERGSRLPEDWKPTPDLEAYARQRGFDPVKILEAFRDHWAAAPGQKGRKANWGATWRTWVRKELIDHPPAKSNGHGPRNEAAWAEATSYAAAVGFRPPLEHESVTAYAQAIETSERTRRATPAGEASARVATLAAKLRSAS